MRRNRKKMSELVAEVEACLDQLEECDHTIATIQESLTAMQLERVTAVNLLARARDALFKEYPELREEIATAAPEPVAPDGPFDPTPIEVDDENDPRYAPGGGGSAPGGTIEFQER